ncbi:hypothetical protein BDY19DRAFT_900168, partial [Irpex rosettiformis]
LVVVDYFKCSADIFVYSTQADQVIAWLRSKTFVLSLLRQLQQRLNPGSTPLSIIRAVPTRWTSHFLAYRRLVKLRYTIMTAIQQDELLPVSQSQLITGNSVAQAKAKEMISYMKDDRFWNAITQITTHLQPFAYATNIAQSDVARLDTVLLAWALLYNHFDNLSESSDSVSDKQIAEAVCNSINRRWEASDQDVFIAAVILNPTHKTRPFAKSSWFGAGLVTVLISRLWQRIFGSPEPSGLQKETEEYLADEGVYFSMRMYWNKHMESAAVSNITSTYLIGSTVLIVS